MVHPTPGVDDPQDLAVFPGLSYVRSTRDPVTFKVRTFHTDPAGETWDFGDGSPPEKVRSDANAKEHAPNGYAEAVHRYARPGHYLVRVEQVGKGGAKVTARLHVEVGEKAEAPDARAK